jgi:hypothetical protein
LAITWFLTRIWVEGQATSSIGLPPERSRMFEQLDFVSQLSGDVAADVEYYTRALAQSSRSQLSGLERRWGWSG